MIQVTGIRIGEDFSQFFVRDGGKMTGKHYANPNSPAPENLKSLTKLIDIGIGKDSHQLFEMDLSAYFGLFVSLLKVKEPQLFP